HATDIPSSPPLVPRYRATSPTSSIPALFSSDGPLEEADIANYESPRYKKKRMGAWWETDNGRGKKAKMSRNFDSGVWMGSDASDSSGGSINAGLCTYSDDLPLTISEQEIDDRAEAEKRMLQYIEKRLDDESYNVSYDFSGFGLQDSALIHLEKLNQVIKPPLNAGVDVPTERQYRPFTVALYINLASNSLSRLAPSVFHMEHLNSLILRDNQIKTLPPQIAHLRTLRELDLSRNKLEYLPAEILDLHQSPTRLLRLQLLGNPLLEPIRGREGGRRKELANLHRLHHNSLQGGNPRKPMYCGLQGGDRAISMWVLRSAEATFPLYQGSKHHRHCPPINATGLVLPKLMAHTLPSYYDQSGHLVENSPPPPSSGGSDFPVILHSSTFGAYGVPEFIFEPSKRSKVFSFLTMSIHEALAHPDDTPDDVRYGLTVNEDGGDPYPIPPQAERLLSAADNNMATIFKKFRTCHCCGKDYIMPRAEWIEFWHNHKSIDCLPVKVQVCSWGCVPDFIAKRPEK
ncbi:hypothetical protein CC80DRAFT_369227, partial [Byssothecium circinans]